VRVILSHHDLYGRIGTNNKFTGDIFLAESLRQSQTSGQMTQTYIFPAFGEEYCLHF
jgi:hypothetical protein